VKRALGRFALFAVVAVGSAAVLITPALLINRYEAALPEGEQLVPWAWRLRAALCYVPFAGPVLFGYWLFMRGRRSFEAVSKRARIVMLVLLLLIAAGAAFTADLIAVLTSDDFIFATTQPSVSTPSPNGKRVGHLVYACFLGCGLTVFVEEKGAWSMKRVGVDWGKTGDVALPEIRWSDDEKFQLVGGAEDFEEIRARTFP
jgi:hypothetical protein